MINMNKLQQVFIISFILIAAIMPVCSATAVEFNYGKGLNDIFKSESGGYSLSAFVANVIEQLDDWSYGTLLGACCLMVIWLIYQKTDSVVAIYFVAVLSTYLLRKTVFVEVTTIFFYIIVLAITAVLFSLLKGRQ